MLPSQPMVYNSNRSKSNPFSMYILEDRRQREGGNSASWEPGGWSCPSVKPITDGVSTVFSLTKEAVPSVVTLSELGQWTLQSRQRDRNTSFQYRLYLLRHWNSISDPSQIHFSQSTLFTLKNIVLLLTQVQQKLFSSVQMVQQSTKKTSKNIQMHINTST